MYITDRSKAVLLIWFSVFSCSRVSFSAVLPSGCVDNIKLGIGRDSEGRTLVLIVSVPSHYYLLLFSRFIDYLVICNYFLCAACS